MIILSTKEVVSPFGRIVSIVVVVDFTQKKIILKNAVLASADGATPAVAEVAIKYGDFISQCITFFVVALVVFMVIKAINKMKKEEAAAPVAPSAQEVLLTEIRDLLKK